MSAISNKQNFLKFTYTLKKLFGFLCCLPTELMRAEVSTSSSSSLPPLAPPSSSCSLLLLARTNCLTVFFACFFAAIFLLDLRDRLFASLSSSLFRIRRDLLGVDMILALNRWTPLLIEVHRSEKPGPARKVYRARQSCGSLAGHAMPKEDFSNLVNLQLLKKF